MRFTKIGAVLSWITVFLGVFSVVIVVIVGFRVPEISFTKNILPEVRQGMWTIFLGVSLGILTEISKSVAKNKVSDPK